MLRAEPTEINLGQVNFGKAYKFTYVLTNVDETNIKVLAFAPGCKSCTTVKLDKDELAKGESANLVTTFTPGSLGIANKQVSVIYSINDVVKPEMILKFKGVVVE